MSTPNALVILRAVEAEQVLTHFTLDTVTRDNPESSESFLMLISLRANSVASCTLSILIFITF